MNLQRTENTTSTLDKALGFSLAAFSMFVVGYTATRAYLAQPQSQNAANADADLVIPHQAQLWSDFGN